MKLPEKTEGPWVTNFDPLTRQWTYSVTYNVSYAEDSPFFHASFHVILAGRSLALPFFAPLSIQLVMTAISSSVSLGSFS